MGQSHVRTFDPAEFKDGIRKEWREAAPGWRAWRATMETEEGGRAVSRTLVEQARLAPGQVVLDVGAGYGEPARQAAQAVSPNGRVVLQDIAGDMLALARRQLEHEAPPEVEMSFWECDAETLDLEPDTFDAVVSRSALMYFVDVTGTLRRLRAGVKPGGRLAASVWSSLDQVGFAAALPVILNSLELPPPPPERPGPFTLGDPELLASRVRDAGWAEVETGTVTVPWEFDSRQACTDFLRAVAPPVTALVADQPPEVRERVWQEVTDTAWGPFTRADGTVRLPNKAHWVSAVNPS